MAVILFGALCHMRQFVVVVFFSHDSLLSAAVALYLVILNAKYQHRHLQSKVFTVTSDLCVFWGI